MGVATDVALIELELYEAPTSMKSSLVVKDRSNNRFLFHSQAHYSQNFSDHIEKILIEEFKKKFPTPQSIPNNAVVIFCSNWSPCIKCLTNDIPDFLNWCNFEKHSFTIKFRFNQFYSREYRNANPNYPNSGRYIWSSKHIAISGYDLLSMKYFNNSRFKDAIFKTEDGEEIQCTKVSPRLVFAKLDGLTKTSFLLPN